MRHLHRQRATAATLEELVARCLEAGSSGNAQVVDQLCEQHPESAEALRRRMAKLAEVGLVGGGDAKPGPVILQDRYRLEERIGSGAMGVVYRARDLELERAVAVKVLPADLFGQEGRRHRFLREAWALASLGHPHVVPVFDRGETADGLMFLVMALLEGMPLSELVDRGRERHGTPAEMGRSAGWVRDLLGGSAPPEPTFLRLAARWAREVASALRAAHDAGVLHRDVKPSNVFITDDCRAVLLDFGLARRDLDPDLTEGQIVGTPNYMSPEQARGAEAMGPATDVYGLCATLYHAVTGRPPFEGDLGEVLMRVREGSPQRASSLHRGLPRDLQAILDRGMERDPLRRYARAAALEQDLDAFLEGRPTAARPLLPIVRAWRVIRRRPARSAAVAATALALALGVSAALLWSADQAVARREERRLLKARLPARAGLEGRADERTQFGDAPRARSLGLLDRLLALRPKRDEIVEMRTLRAALLLDRGAPGDHQRAAADMRAVADAVPTPYLRAIAAGYASADTARKGAEAVDLSSVRPSPSTPEDRYVAGFHALRYRAAGFVRSARELLAAADAFAPARELGLLAGVGEAGGLFNRGRRREGLELYRRVAEEAEAIEAESGQTARTRALLGLARQRMWRFREAAEALEGALALAPDQHGDWLNLAAAYHRQYEPTRALACLDRAEAARPGYWNTAYERALVFADVAAYDRAWEVARAIPDASFPEPWRKPYLLGELRLHEGRRLLTEDDERAAPMLTEARGWFEQAVAASGRAGLPHARLALTEALLANDRDRAARLFAGTLQADPLDPYRLFALGRLLPDDDLSSETAGELKELIAAMAMALAPHLDPSR